VVELGIVQWRGLDIKVVPDSLSGLQEHLFAFLEIVGLKRLDPPLTFVLVGSSFPNGFLPS
jgi:hypothetical protein